MFDKVIELITKSILDPIKYNLTLALFVSGCVAILVGALGGDWLDDLPYVPHGSGEAVLKIGSAILGAGVFAVIMKSAQFTEVFQNHVHNVFYDPARTFGLDDLKQKWLGLTRAILEATLPAMHSDASKRIMEQFLDAELQYHFYNYETKNDVRVDKATKIATILHTTRTTLVISPNQDDPVLTQEVLVTDGDCKLRTLIINNQPIDFEGLLLPSDSNPRAKQLTLKLKDYATESGAGDKIVGFERTYEITQNLESDQELSATIKRFVKGLTVKAKIGEGYRLYFTKTGPENTLRPNGMVRPTS